MSGDLRAAHRPHAANRCQAKDPSTCPYHGSTSSAAVSRGDINAFIDAKEREAAPIDTNLTRVEDKTASRVISEITKAAGGKLNKSQAVAADAISKWYASGELKSHMAKMIQFNSDVPEIVKDGKTIGIIQIGNEGNQYFYEVEGDKVAFRQADGHDRKGEKLPWNYGMRKKLDGKAITENNIKWGAEAMLARYGM